MKDLLEIIQILQSVNALTDHQDQVIKQTNCLVQILSQLLSDTVLINSDVYEYLKNKYLNQINQQIHLISSIQTEHSHSLSCSNNRDQRKYISFDYHNQTYYIDITDRENRHQDQDQNSPVYHVYDQNLVLIGELKEDLLTLKQPNKTETVQLKTVENADTLLFGQYALSM